MNIKIKKEVISSLKEIAKDAHPKEMLMFLEGTYNSKEVYVKDLIFQPYFANERSALPRIDLPLTTKIIGSFHSHPGASNRPSNADMHFFNKTGIIHGIIHFPYDDKNIEFYDVRGNKIVVEII